MAKSTHISRSLKLYLDGKEVKTTVSDLNKELKEAKKELKDAKIGSNAYRMALEKVGTLVLIHPSYRPIKTSRVYNF